MSQSMTKLELPMDVEFKPTWLSWVGAVTGCLNALGHECDVADVAGQSGYAFHISVAPNTCPSGPSMLDWDALSWGVRAMGRATDLYWSGDCYTGKFINDRTRAHARYAFEKARAEIAAGRPCVVWGTPIPEFAVCKGIEGESYVVSTCMSACGQEQPPVQWDKIDAPGGPCTIAFPTVTDFPQIRRDHAAVTSAVNVFNFNLPPFKHGAAAYDIWIKALKDKTAIVMGNSYAANCYADGRALAHTFLGRVAERNAWIGDDIHNAAKLYGKSAEVMKVVAKVFPFAFAQEPVSDDAAIQEAIPALEEAKKNEVKAMKLLEKISLLPWQKQPCACGE